MFILLLDNCLELYYVLWIFNHVYYYFVSTDMELSIIFFPLNLQINEEVNIKKNLPFRLKFGGFYY